MARLFCLRAVLCTFIVLLVAVGFSCRDDPVVIGPKIPNPKVYALNLELYRTGTDFRAVARLKDPGSGAVGTAIVGRGGVLIMRGLDSERFKLIPTGMANDLTGVQFSDNELRIAGMGLGLNDPGVIKFRTLADASWHIWDHPARGGITDLTVWGAVTSVGEIITYHNDYIWNLSFEDVGGAGLAGVTHGSGYLTAVGASGRIFRNPTNYDYSTWDDETIANGPDFKDVGLHVPPAGVSGAVPIAVGGTEIWERNNGTWEMVLDNAGGELFGVSEYSNSVNASWAVGANGTILKGVVGEAWSETSVGSDITLRGVSRDGKLVCGDNGAIYYYDDVNGWTDLGCANTESWNAIDGLSANEIYAANGDTLAQWNGTDWEFLGDSFDEIISLHVSSSNRIWVVNRSDDGFDYFVKVWDGSKFNFSHQSSLDPFNSIWCDDTGDTAFVAADNGYVFRKGALGWEWLTADPTRRHFYDLDGTSARDLYVVGQDGLIVHFDGINWTPMNTGAKHDVLRAIDGPIAVGDNGLVLRRNGSSWRSESSGTTANLYAVCYLGADDVWAAGATGQVIHYNGSEWHAYRRVLETIDFKTVWGHTSAPKEMWFGGENGFLLKSFVP